MSGKKYLHDLVSPAEYNAICNKILATRNEDDDGAVTYEEIEHVVDGTKYKVLGVHYPVQEVIDRADPKCKKCLSKGYTTVSVPKTKLPDPSGYFLEEVQPDPKMWRITTPCECGVLNIINDDPSVFTIDTRCVFVSISFTSETAKPKIEIVR